LIYKNITKTIVTKCQTLRLKTNCISAKTLPRSRWGAYNWLYLKAISLIRKRGEEGIGSEGRDKERKRERRRREERGLAGSTLSG